MKRVSLTAICLLMLSLIAACVAIPTKDNPSAYTRSFVQDAIRRYERDGKEATVAYHSSVENVDGQWYVFIGEDGHIIAHHMNERIGLALSEMADPTGYLYGEEILNATVEGSWVSYIFRNPETGEEERKHSWVVLHDGLIFGSGWYE